MFCFCDFHSCSAEARVPSAVGRGDAHSAGEGGSAVAGHTWLQRQRVLHHEPHPSDGDIIELNCGGSVMVTSRSTLRQVCPVSSKHTAGHIGELVLLQHQSCGPDLHIARQTFPTPVNSLSCISAPASHPTPPARACLQQCSCHLPASNSAPARVCCTDPCWYIPYSSSLASSLLLSACVLSVCMCLLRR